MLNIRCPNCLNPGTAPITVAGRKVRCGKCRTVFIAEVPPEPTPDVTEVAWAPGLPAPGEEPTCDLSKLDNPQPEPLPDDKPEPLPEPRRIRSRDRDDRDDEEDDEPPVRRRRKHETDLWNSLQTPVSFALVGSALLGGLAWSFEANRLGRIDGTNAFAPDNATEFSAVMFGFAGVVCGAILGGLCGFWYAFTSDASRRSRRGRA